MFVLLAAVFAIGFVVFGVGSGSTGISSALQNAFNFGGSSGPSISSLKHKTAAQPQDAGAWRDLATAYEQKHQTANAVAALRRYTQLRPKDASALQELAAQYSTLAGTYSTQAQDAQTAAQQADPGAIFAPPASTALGRAFSDTNQLRDPIAAALAQQASSQTTQAYQRLTAVETEAEAAYKKLARLDPNDASTQVQLGQAAQAANDTKTAIAAYRRFLKLAPTDPLAPQVRSVLKQLAPAKKK
jgi:cytochrome c-type biogenesis protein CcmH/NrfG